MVSKASDKPSPPPPLDPADRSKIRSGLILAGGGAQGAYEVGVIKALLAGKSFGTRYTPLEVDVIAGTSVGSVNASLTLSAYDQGPAAISDFLQKVWLDDIADAPGRCNSAAFRIRANPLNFITWGCYSPNPAQPFIQLAEDSAAIGGEVIKRTLNLFSGGEQLEQRAFELLNIGVLVSSDPLKNLLMKTIRLDKIRSARQRLRIVATNWAKGILGIFDNHDMTDEQGIKVIMASSAIPGVYAPVEINGNPYVDGGVLMNTPLKPAIDAGANELHIIYMQPDVSRFRLPALQNTVDDVYRSLVIGYGLAVIQDIEVARKVNGCIAFLEGRKKIEDISPGKTSSAVVAAAAELTGRAAGVSHQPLIVHRYHPNGDPGVGWLSFGIKGIQHLMDLGFNDTVKHDCEKNQCVLPS